MSTGQRLRKPHVEASDLPLEPTSSPAVEIFLWSRAAIWAAALFAFLVFEPNRHPEAARWDSIFFLRIAEHGYEHLVRSATAFLQLYPAVVGLVGRVFFGHYVLAG